jgi:hypothetical protein
MNKLFFTFMFLCIKLWQLKSHYQTLAEMNCKFALNHTLYQTFKILWLGYISVHSKMINANLSLNTFLYNQTLHLKEYCTSCPWPNTTLNFLKLKCIKLPKNIFSHWTFNHRAYFNQWKVFVHLFIQTLLRSILTFTNGGPFHDKHSYPCGELLVINGHMVV